MSNYHVCEINEDMNHAQVAFHIVTPSGNNSAGIAYSTALKQYLERNQENGIIKSQIPWITPTELSQLQAGTLYEYYVDCEFSNAYATDLEKRNELDAKYNILVPRIQEKISKILRFWGMNRDVS